MRDFIRFGYCMGAIWVVQLIKVPLRVLCRGVPQQLFGVKRDPNSENYPFSFRGKGTTEPPESSGMTGCRFRAPSCKDLINS